MKWLFSDSDWQKIVENLPAGADRAQFCAAVTRAVEMYQREGLPDAEVWAQIARLLKGKSLEKVFETIEQLKRCKPSLPAKYLLALRQNVDFQAQYEDGQKQQCIERFYHNVIVACISYGGLKLSNSDKGPLARVLELIFNAVLPAGKPLTPRGIREIVHREIERRREEATRQSAAGAAD